MSRQFEQEAGIGDRAGDVARAQGRGELVEGGITGVAVDDDLRDHRVVERRDRVAFAHTGVNAHAVVFGREAQRLERAGRRQEPFCSVFGIKPGFERPAVDGEIGLCDGQGFAARNANLPLDEIVAGDQSR